MSSTVVENIIILKEEIDNLMAYQNEAVQFGWQAALYLGEADTSKIATHMEEEKLEKVQQCDVVNEQIIADGGAEDEGPAVEGEA